MSWIDAAIKKQKRDMAGVPQSLLDAYAGKVNKCGECGHERVYSRGRWVCVFFQTCNCACAKMQPEVADA